MCAAHGNVRVMQIIIGNVVPPEEIATIRGILDGARFVDGRATAGIAASLVKHNEQADSSERGLETARKLVANRIIENEVFRIAVRPKKLTPLLFSRYGPGMHYGSHVDDALMNAMRTDVSFTLFLSEPDSYEGGELVVETAAGNEVVKLEAGSLVAYPSTTLHHVHEVTSGVRLAAVGWARSYIRDPAQRELLFDLDTARQRLFARNGKSEDYDLVSKSLTNLMRMWADD